MVARQPVRTLCARVPPPEAADALALLEAMSLLDPRFTTTTRDGAVHVPVREAAATAELDWPLVRALVRAHPKRAPIDRVRDALFDRVPEDVLARMPTTWQLLGDVLLVRPEPRLGDHAGLVYETLAATIGARAVLELDGAEGELRRPVTRHVWGATDTRTVHVEAGLRYHLDPAEVLFSQGNVHERHRLVDLVRAGETIVDLFAGVGYFTLPLARAGGRVVACEKNPVSAGFLRQNVFANELDARVEVREGDCREHAPQGVADRVLLGYFPGTRDFLDCALAALKPGGGTLHYHTTANEPDAFERAVLEVLDAWPADQPAPHVVGQRRVKSYAPGVSHVVLDLEVRR